MAEIVPFPGRTKAETVLMEAISIVQAASPPNSGISRDELLDLLLEVLDGPDALDVYNRLLQTY